MLADAAADHEESRKPLREAQPARTRACAHVEADLVTRRAAAVFDRGETEANMAKLLATDASREKVGAAAQTFGGRGLDAEYDVERTLRGTRPYRAAQISIHPIAGSVLVYPRAV